MGILFTAVFSGIEIIWDRQFGFLKETLVAPVSRLQIVLGRTLGGATVALIQGTVVFIICLFAGFRFDRAPLLPIALVFMFLIAVLFTAIGTAIGSVLEDMQGFQLIMNFIVMPLFFFSNALFPVQGLPKPLQFLLHLNPLTYGIDGIRGAFSEYFFLAWRPILWCSALSRRSCWPSEAISSPRFNSKRPYISSFTLGLVTVRAIHLLGT